MPTLTEASRRRQIRRRIEQDRRCARRAFPDTGSAQARRRGTADQRLRHLWFLTLGAQVAPYLQVRFDRAHLKTLDQDWIEFEVLYFVQDADYTLFMDTQQTVILACMQMFAEMGIPTAAPPRQLLVMPAEPEGPDTADGVDGARVAHPVRGLQRGG